MSKRKVKKNAADLAYDARHQAVNHLLQMAETLLALNHLHNKFNPEVDHDDVLSAEAERNLIDAAHELVNADNQYESDQPLIGERG